MTDKTKDKEVKTSEELIDEAAEAAKKNEKPSEFPLGESNEKLNPTTKIADEASEKPEAEKTEGEKFIEAKEGLNKTHDLASSAAAGGGADDDGLADLGADGKPKKIVPPVTAADESDEGDDGEGYTTSYEKNPDEDVFEPENDHRAALHGTHDAAVFGLHTDISGAYVPPGLAKAAEDRQLEEENQERHRKATAQQREMAYDSGLRHDRRF